MLKLIKRYIGFIITILPTKKSPNFIRTKDRHQMTQCSGQSNWEEQKKIMD